MNKTLKWILIGLAIAAGAFLLSLPIFYIARHADSLAGIDGLRTPMRTTFHTPFRVLPMLAVMPVVGIFGIFRVLIPLIVVGLAVWGVVALVRGRRSSQPPPPVPSAASERVCNTCGKPLYNQGEYCPFCGSRQ